MAIYNLGSINVDHVYHVPHIPVGGETLASSSFENGLGGKGANQSIAAAKSGAKVKHIGAVGSDASWTLDELGEHGVDTTLVQESDTPTGHAIIYVDQSAENMIVLFPGANVALEISDVERALANASKGDWLVLQNETNLTVDAAQTAQKKGMKVCYSAAPFDADAVRDILEHVDLLAVNQIEAEQISNALNIDVQDIPVTQLLVTKGKNGAEYWHAEKKTSVDAFNVTPVDTTGAGDTFLGFFVGSLDQGLKPEDALKRASAAAALQVTKKGAAEAIPQLSDVLEFLKD